MLRILAIVFVLSVSTSADAAMLHHHDLASLAFMSDAIVKVERQGAFGSPMRVRITHAYKGTLRAGTNMDLPLGSYALGAEFGTPDNTMLVFLSERNGAWRITPSGIRVADAAGRVHRFEQQNNPGPYVPVPQGNDPQDVRGSAEQPTIDFAQLEPMLVRALRRADAMRAALGLSGAERREAVLSLLPAPAETRQLAPESSFYNDALADRAAHALAQSGDVRGVLEVWCRSSGDRVRSRSVLRRHGDAVFQIAMDEAAPFHRRAMALRSLFRQNNRPSEQQARMALGLLSDASPEIRAAALVALDFVGSTQTDDPEWPRTQRRIRRLVQAALHDHWGRETDGAVRVQMLRSRAIWRVRPRRVGRFAFAAHRADEDLRYIWARRDEGSTGVVLEITNANGVCATNPARTHATHGQLEGSGSVTPVQCARPWNVVVSDADRVVARTTVN